MKISEGCEMEKPAMEEKEVFGVVGCGGSESLGVDLLELCHGRALVEERDKVIGGCGGERKRRWGGYCGGYEHCRYLMLLGVIEIQFSSSCFYGLNVLPSDIHADQQ